MKGNGFLNIENKDVQIKPGSIIFVPAKKKHHFHGNEDEFQILYVFAGKEKYE